jgi:mono/diheme cytochrome c family protein
MKTIHVRAVCAAAFLLAACADFTPEVGTGASAQSGDAGRVSFARDLRPILNRLKDDPRGPGCASCHYTTAGDHQGIDLGGLDMTTLGSLRKGGITRAGTIAIPGNPEGSAIVQKLRGTYKLGARMPRSGPPYLTDAEIQLFVDWIDAGAKGEDSE